MKWKPIPDWPQYEVSELGHVRSLDRVVVRGDGTRQTWPSRYLKIQLPQSGYPVVRLSDAVNGRRAVAKVHRLVAAAFLPNPRGFREVNHKDGNKQNRQVDNLEWCSTKHNAVHAAQHRLNPIVSLLDDQVREARAAHSYGESIRSIARRLERDRTSIRAMLRNKTYQWVSPPPPGELT